MDRDLDPTVNRNLPNLSYDHAWAIIRVDKEMIAQDVSDLDSVSNSVTVNRVLWSENEARDETERLNLLNRDKGAFYFYQVTRIARR